MANWIRIPLGGLLAAFFALAALIPAPHNRSVAAAASSPTQAGAADPKALYDALNALFLDNQHVYSARDIHLRRSAIDLTLTDGKLAFLDPIGGKITGAVFTGRGHIIVLPRDAAERRSLAKFVHVPLLDQAFSRAYLRFTDDTAETLLRDLAAAGIAPKQDREFITTWASTVSDLNPSHTLRILFDWLSTNPAPYFSAAIAGTNVGTFDAVLDRRRPETFFIGQNRPNTQDAYDVWTSFTPKDAPPAPINFYPIDYKVDTSIADDLSLQGDAHLHLKARSGGERMISLELSRSLTVQSVTDESGKPLLFFHNNDLSQQELAHHGNDAVYVILPAAPAADSDVRLEFRYHGSVISDSGNGVYFVGERGSWYPHVGGGDHFVPFDLTFRWPRKLTLVATGKPSDLREDDGERTGRWTATIPIAVAGFNLGEYEKEIAGPGQPTIDLYANRELDEWIVARLRARGEPLDALNHSTGDIRSIAPVKELPSDPNLPVPKQVLKRLGAEVLDSIHFYEAINGPFPFEQLEISPIPGNFGQGWPGLVYLSTLAYVPRETQAEAGINKIEQEEIEQLLPYHEVAHQWWGNVVGIASYRDAWLNEAIANYLSLMYGDSKKPGAHSLNTWLTRYRNELVAPLPGSDDTLADVGSLTLGYRLTSSKTPNAYDKIIYGKGSWVLHMLRTMFHDPAAKNPDAKFEEALRSLLEEHKFQAVTTDDLQRAFEKRMTPAMDLEGNKKLNWFFDEWVRDTGVPHYKVVSQTRSRNGEFVISGTLTQDNVPDYFIASVPLYISVSGGKPIHLGTVITSGPETPFHFTSHTRPGKILIDPQETILCKPE